MSTSIARSANSEFSPFSLIPYCSSLRLFRGTIVLVVLVAFSPHAWAQENQPEPADRVLAMMNDLRAKAGVPAFQVDKRLNDAATLHASEVLQNGRVADQFEGEPSLPERLRLAQIPCASAGEVILSVLSLDEVPAELMPSDKAILLNPKFTLAGAAVVPSGKRSVIVVNLARPFRSLSMDEVEQYVADAVQRMRTDNKLLALKVIPMRRLRGIACDMAKKDSLKTSPINPYEDYIGPPAQEARNFMFTSFDPGMLPTSVQPATDNPKINALSVGACFAASPTYPSGTYWVYLVLYAWTHHQM